ncbi:hypothetical protein FRB91_007636 [Serendipita sp. 411]|nr:hypothetical protein FRC18_005258 [Serendipita sp. 400]KAG8851596.1 hypothetical protein FRB91_007636 [Serendipita sp. 411]
MLWHINIELWIWVPLLLQVLSSGVYAARNVTVDDADPSIKYTGAWLTTARSDRYMNTTHYTKTKGSYATFSFTGATQVYFMGYGLTRASEDTNIAIVLDGETHVVDIYRDTSEYLQAILWSSDALDPTTKHTIECRKTSEDYGSRDLNVDAFILTIPDMATSPSVASTNPSGSPSPTTIVSSSTESGLDATGNDSSIVTSRATSSLTINEWNPSLDPNTLYQPISTSAVQSDGTVQASSSGSSGPNNLSKSVVVGVIFGAIGSVCLIAVVFFYLGRRRDPPQHLETLQFYAMSSHYAEGSPKSEQSTEQPTFLGTARPIMKQGENNHEEPHQRRSVSSISSGNTQSRSGHIRVSAIDSYVIPDGSQNDAWTVGPPAYTARPTAGHSTSTTALRTGETSIPQYEIPRIRDVKARQRL